MRKTCLKMVYELAKKDSRVVFIGSDIGAGTLDEFKRDFPDRFFMEGVSEQNIVGMAAGLALSGKIVYINTIATFMTRRCYEQILLDLALHQANVRLIGSGGGFVYGPLGPTHEGIEDIAIMRVIPNMTVVAPADAEEMKRLMPQTLEWKGPIYIRLGKGGDTIVTSPELGFDIGEPILMKKGKDVLIISTGIMLGCCLQAEARLKKSGLSCGVLHVHTLKPLNKKVFLKEMKNVNIIVTVEEHSVIGGLGEAIAVLIAEANFKEAKKFKRIGIPDVFPEIYGSQDQLLEKYGLTVDNITDTVLKLRKG